jgi:3-phenylpropionate/trans-cinnamate dioxygenase ferredoxin reductase subunit
MRYLALAQRRTTMDEVSLNQPNEGPQPAPRRDRPAGNADASREGKAGEPMPRYPYLIVGGGMTADAAVAGIREVDPNIPIGVIGAEPDPPYNRPPLSKGLWKGEPLAEIWRNRTANGATLHLGRRVQSLDARDKQVTDDQGVVYQFDRCLLAMGATPRRLPFGDDQIIYFRTVADYRRLRVLADRGQRFAVVGGGFIGSEVAAALALNGKQVTLLLRGGAIGEHTYPRDLARFLDDYYRQKGVELLTGATVESLRTMGSQVAVRIRDGQPPSEREVPFDGVVAGLGILPRVELAQQAGLAVENGIVVDEFLRTTHPDVYAAGDVANFFNPALGKRLRVEHEDNANTMGRLAGRAMAGQAEPYHHLPFFYSDLFELGYEAVGELDARLQIVADWTEPFRQGVVYYLRDGRVRGVLLWNVWGQVDAARRLIEAPGPFQPADLKGRLPEAS